jgi:hypothetical protein
MKKTVLLVLSMGVASCSDAEKSSAVVPEYVPASVYAGYTCRELQVEADRIIASTPILEENVDREYRKDRAAEAAAWVLFWPAAFAMNGNTGERRSLAISRGRLDAIYANLNSKNC